MVLRLTSELEELLERVKALGEYDDPNDVIEAALRLLENRIRQDRYDAMIQIGIDQLDRGESVEWTPEWSASRRAVALQRFAAGEKPNPDILPEP